MAVATIHDMLSLKVVHDGKGRRIRSGGLDPTKYVSKNGQKFYNGTWRVRLHECNDPDGGRRLIVLINYRGHKTAKRNSLGCKFVYFNTGLLQMRLKRTECEDGIVKDEIELELIDLGEVW